MAARAKTKSIAKPAAQSREEAEELIARMGDLQRQIARRQADYGDQAARMKAEHEKALQPLGQELEEARERVQGWCEANRNELTRNGKVKFAALATGEVKWRALPPKVSLRNVEGVIEALQRLGLTRFLRTKVEVNKEAMLAEPKVAATVAGVTIASAGEEFVVEPFEPELVSAA